MRYLNHIAVVGVTGYTGFELARILVRHPGVGSVHLLYARDAGGQVSRRIISSAARARRRSPAHIFGGGHLREQCGHRVSGHSSRRLGDPRAFVGRSGNARGGFERRISFPVRGNLHELVQIGRATCATTRRGGLRRSRNLRRQNQGCAHRGKSRMLCDQRHPGASPFDRRGLDCRGTAAWSAIASPGPAAPEKSCGAICSSSRWTTISKPTIFFRTGTLRKFWSTPGWLSPGDFLHAFVADQPGHPLHHLREPGIAAERRERSKRCIANFMPGARWCASGPPGSLPELQHVAHTNFCDIGFVLDKTGRRLVIVSCLDNLGKGAAGQAVQNFNHILGIEEHTALQ